MKESFLHYIWQYQLFAKKTLFTTSGESVKIFKVGSYEQKAGPDFTNASIEIGTQLWAGNIEIHINSSDWYHHNHQLDPAYDNVILHVVWEEDMPVMRKNNTPVSTLELKGLISQNLLQNYQALNKEQPQWIACENNLETIEPFTWKHWLERIYLERLEQKAGVIQTLLKQTNNDWEGVLFLLLAKGFGLKLNGDVFLDLFKSIDYNIIQKEKHNSENLEALLFGIAGLLEHTETDPYKSKLKSIFSFQKHKYQLQETTLQVYFHRLRPPNFPTIRLSQLAQLFAHKQHLFNELSNAKTKADLYKILHSQTSTYWESHYIFGKVSKKIIKKTSKSFIDLLIINTVVPLLFTYAKSQGNEMPDILLKLIESIEPEKNSIVQAYAKLQVVAENALDSQALLTLNKNYCQPKMCLNCEIGLQILKQ